MIELSAIRKEFTVGEETLEVLADVDLVIADGDYVSVMGPSGSGKSTLLNIIALLDRPTAGQYRFAGRDVTELTDDALARVRRDNIGFVFQFFHLIPRLTAAENVALPLVLAGMLPRARKERVDRALEEFGLAHRARHRPEQLSGGERQRVAIARATIMEPGVLLADEPTGNLDRHSGAQAVALLEALNARGVTLVVVTHDAELGRRARRWLRLADGVVVEERAQPAATGTAGGAGG